MKKRIIFLSLLILAITASAFAQDAEPLKLSWTIIIPIILGIYDVLARIIPTVNDWSWLSWIVKFLNFLNEFFNRKKRK